MARGIVTTDRLVGNIEPVHLRMVNVAFPWSVLAVFFLSGQWRNVEERVRSMHHFYNGDLSTDHVNTTTEVFYCCPIHWSRVFADYGL